MQTNTKERGKVIWGKKLKFSLSLIFSLYKAYAQLVFIYCYYNSFNNNKESIVNEKKIKILTDFHDLKNNNNNVYTLENKKYTHVIERTIRF